MNSYKKYLLSVICAAVLTSVVSTAIAAPAQKSQSMDLNYDVYASGFKALHADFDVKLDPKAYDIAIEARTQGMIGGLFPWQGSYRTAGHNDDNTLIPTQHTARSVWQKKEKLTEISYAPNGEVLKMTTREDGKTVTNRDIRRELSEDSVDLLTGTLLMIQSAKITDKCEGSIPVFDGKRRYNLVLKGNTMDEIRKSDYSIYSGPALKCTLNVEPVAGFKPKDQKRGWMAIQNHTLARKKPPTIWFAAVEPGGPVVPVRMEISSDYGAAVAHVTGSHARVSKKEAKD